MVALVVLRNKAIKPLLAAAQRRRKSRGAQNPSPIDKHYETIRTAMQGVFDELGFVRLNVDNYFFKLSAKRLTMKSGAQLVRSNFTPMSASGKAVCSKALFRKGASHDITSSTHDRGYAGEESLIADPSQPTASITFVRLYTLYVYCT